MMIAGHDFPAYSCEKMTHAAAAFPLLQASIANHLERLNLGSFYNFTDWLAVIKTSSSAQTETLGKYLIRAIDGQTACV